jgi:hypothetical protein
MIHYGDGDKQVPPSDHPALQEHLKGLAGSQDSDHPAISFREDGSAQFSRRTNNPQRLYQPWRWLWKVLRQYPKSVRCAAGACQGGHRHDAR